MTVGHSINSRIRRVMFSRTLRELRHALVRMSQWRAKQEEKQDGSRTALFVAISRVAEQVAEIESRMVALLGMVESGDAGAALEARRVLGRVRNVKARIAADFHSRRAGRSGEQGIALVMALWILLLLSVLILAFLQLAAMENLIASSHERVSQARAAAESGIEASVYGLNNPTATGNGGVPYPIINAATVTGSGTGWNYSAVLTPGSAPFSVKVDSHGMARGAKQRIQAVMVVMAPVLHDVVSANGVNVDGRIENRQDIQCPSRAVTSGPDGTSITPPNAQTAGGTIYGYQASVSDTNIPNQPGGVDYLDDSTTPPPIFSADQVELTRRSAEAEVRDNVSQADRHWLFSDDMSSLITLTNGFSGVVITAGYVVVPAGVTVRAHIQASSVDVSGSVSGVIHASNAVSILPTGVVTGDCVP
jgi:bactofilin/type IV pilus assembly PilX-like protein